ASSRGFATGVGRTFDQAAPRTCRGLLVSSGSPGSPARKVFSNWSIGSLSRWPGIVIGVRAPRCAFEAAGRWRGPLLATTEEAGPCEWPARRRSLVGTGEEL